MSAEDVLRRMLATSLPTSPYLSAIIAAVVCVLVAAAEITTVGRSQYVNVISAFRYRSPVSNIRASSVIEFY